MIAVAEQIAQKIASRLAKISIANGYALNIQAVVRPTRDGQLVTASGTRYAGPVNNLAVLLQGDSQRDSNGLTMGGKSAWMTDFYIALFIVPKDSASAPVDALANEIVASAMQAVATSEDTTPWGKMGGLAVESVFTNVQMFQPVEGEHAGANVTIQVQYRHPENNPFVAA